MKKRLDILGSLLVPAPLISGALTCGTVLAQSYPVKPMNMPHQEFAAVVKESRAAYVSLFSRISIKLQ